MKTITLDTVEKIDSPIRYNVLVSGGIDEPNMYVPVRIQFTATAKGEGAERKGATFYVDFGAAAETKKTWKEIYQLLPAPLQAAYKNAILDAVNVDVT